LAIRSDMRSLDFLKPPPLSIQDLYLVLGVLGGFFLLLLFIALYLRYEKKKRKYKHFVMVMNHRDLSETQLRCLFRYVYKHDFKPEILLESEKVLEEAIRFCDLDEKEIKKKMGFDQRSLIHDFIKRQEELRRKWNS